MTFVLKVAIGWMMMLGHQAPVTAFSAKSIPHPWEERWDGSSEGSESNSFRGFRRYRSRRKRGYQLDGEMKNTGTRVSDSRVVLAATGDDSSDNETITILEGKEGGIKTGKDDEDKDAEHYSISEGDNVSNLVARQGTMAMTAKKSVPTVLSCRRELWAMCRPSNFVGVFIFHALGAFLGVRANVTGMTEQPIFQLLQQTLSKPSMMVVLFCLLLVSSSSMMVNDYYDARKSMSSLYNNGNNSKNYFINGKVPSVIVKRCLSYMYAALLVSLALVPGTPARLAVASSSMLTFWYTQHLKPITWLKNVTCAVIMAMAPFTSFSAATSGQLWQNTEVWRLTTMLFCGFVGREMLMDIVDVEEDSLSQVRTVPVKYGTRFASRVALTFTLVMTLLAGFGSNWKSRALGLAGGGIQTLRMAQITMFQHGYNENQEQNTTDLMKQAIEEGKITLLLLLASFL